MLDLIERKAAGEEIAIQPQAEEPAAALQDLDGGARSQPRCAVGEDDEDKPKSKSSRSSDGAASKKKTAKAS